MCKVRRNCWQAVFVMPAIHFWTVPNISRNGLALLLWLCYQSPLLPVMKIDETWLQSPVSCNNRVRPHQEPHDILCHLLLKSYSGKTMTFEAHLVWRNIRCVDTVPVMKFFRFVWIPLWCTFVKNNTPVITITLCVSFSWVEPLQSGHALLLISEHLVWRKAECRLCELQLQPSCKEKTKTIWKVERIFKCF